MLKIMGFRLINGRTLNGTIDYEAQGMIVEKLTICEKMINTMKRDTVQVFFGL